MGLEHVLPFTAKEIEEKLNKVDEPVSWNDLNDRPFSEEIYTEDIVLEFDENTTELPIVGGLVKVSDLTPEPSELVGGTVVYDSLVGQNYGKVLSISEQDIRDGSDEGYPVYTVLNCIMVVLEPYSDPSHGVVQPGIYFGWNSEIHTRSLTYTRTVRDIKKLDPKFLPEGGVGYDEDISIGDRLSWDGTSSDTVITLLPGVEFHHISDATPPMADLFGGFVEVNMGETVAIELTPDNLMAFNEDVYGIILEGEPAIAVSLVDDLSVNFEGLKVYIPKKGIYFPKFEGNAIVQSLYKDGYNFIRTEVHRISPKYLPEGGFGYEETSTGEILIEYDGDRTGKTAVLPPDSDFWLVKVSDLTPEPSELIGAVATANGQSLTITADDIEDGRLEDIPLAAVGGGMLMICYEPIPFYGITESGMYIVDMGVPASLKYVGTRTNTHKIDPKYLPDGIGYEEQTTTTSNTLVYDGQPTDTGVLIDGIRFYHISDSTPEASDLIGGVFVGGGQTMQIDEGTINDIDECVFGVADLMLVCSEDNHSLDGVTFIKKGIYAISMIGQIPYPVSLTCQNYQFTQTINKLHHVDIKYIKEGLFERTTPNQVLLDTVITAAESSSDFNIIDDEAVLSVFDSLRDGRAYSIVWNGVKYNCSKFQYVGASFIGNMSWLGGSSSFVDTGEPFLYCQAFGDSALYTVDAGDVSIKIIGDAIQYAELPRETLVNATPLVLSEGDFANPTEVRSQITAAHTALQNHRRVYCVYNGKLVEMIAMYHHLWDMSDYSAFSLSTLDRNIIYDYNCYFSNGQMYTNSYCQYIPRTTAIQQKSIISSTASGAVGEMCYDSDYMYVCVAENTWKRFALETW